MTIDRRSFLWSAAAGAALGLPGSARAAQDEQSSCFAVRRKRIPKTGELLPMIGLGTSRTFDENPSDQNAALREVLAGFLDRGGSLIDSSPMYGQAEAMTGALLARLARQDLFFATKVWTDEGREAGIRQMEQSRERMGARRIDLMQVHNLVGLETHLPTLREWKAEGRIRYLGVTEMRDFETVERLIREADLDFIQIPYSLAEREVEARILPAARDHGVAVLVMRPFQRGRLFQRFRGMEVPAWARDIGCGSWAQLFLKFVLGHPAVTCPIPATSKPHHLVDNMGAGVGPLPDEGARRRMAGLLD